MPDLTHGVIKAVVLADPAAGANFSYTVPTNLRQRLLSVSFHFATSAVANNRRVVLSLLVSGIATIIIVPESVQAASLDVDYSYAIGHRSLAAIVDSVITVPLPNDIIMTAGNILSSLITNKGVADQVTDIRLVVDEVILP